MTGARLTVLGALVIVLGSLGNAISVRQPTAVLGFLISSAGAWWLILNAAKRGDPLAKRLVQRIRPNV